MIKKNINKSINLHHQRQKNFLQNQYYPLQSQIIKQNTKDKSHKVAITTSVAVSAPYEKALKQSSRSVSAATTRQEKRKKLDEQCINPKTTRKYSIDKKSDYLKIRSNTHTQTIKRLPTMNSLKQSCSPKKIRHKFQLLKLQMPSKRKQTNDNFSKNIQNYYAGYHPINKKSMKQIKSQQYIKSNSKVYEKYDKILQKCKKTLNSYKEQLQSINFQNKILRQENKELKNSIIKSKNA